MRGFDPGRQDRCANRDEFLARFAERAGVTYAARAVERPRASLRRHITAGEMDDVLSQLPSGCARSAAGVRPARLAPDHLRRPLMPGRLQRRVSMITSPAAGTVSVLSDITLQ